MDLIVVQVIVLGPCRSGNSTVLGSVYFVLLPNIGFVFLDFDTQVIGRYNYDSGMI